VLYAGTRGYLDPVPVEDVKRWEGELLDVMRTRHSGLLDDIRSTGKLDEDALKAALDGFAEIFTPGDRSGTAPDATDQGEADLAKAGGRREAILPEEEITRPDEDEG